MITSTFSRCEKKNASSTFFDTLSSILPLWLCKIHVGLATLEIGLTKLIEPAWILSNYKESIEKKVLKIVLLTLFVIKGIFHSTTKFNYVYTKPSFCPPQHSKKNCEIEDKI